MFKKGDRVISVSGIDFYELNGKDIFLSKGEIGNILDVCNGSLYIDWGNDKHMILCHNTKTIEIYYDYNKGDIVKAISNIKDGVGIYSKTLVNEGILGRVINTNEYEMEIEWDNEEILVINKNSDLIRPYNGKIINNENQIKNEEDLTVNNLNFLFKQINNGECAITYSGDVAIKRSNGDYVRYNNKTNSIDNLMNMVIQGVDNFIILMPSNDIAIGDMVKQGNKYFQVLNTQEGNIEAIDLENGTRTQIVKETNLFGLGNYIKVTNLMNIQNGGAVNPMMLMMMNNSSNMNMQQLMMIQMLQGNGSNDNNINPLLMMNMFNK